MSNMPKVLGAIIYVFKTDGNKVISNITENILERRQRRA
jgi:hypothetical protein